jgi:hypothetical protein
MELLGKCGKSFFVQRPMGVRQDAGTDLDDHGSCSRGDFLTQ